MDHLLLDTHTFLWWLNDDAKLGSKAREALRNPKNNVYVSAATGWEISIKKALGKLEAPDDINTIVEEERFLQLPITLLHGEKAGQLPLHHRDPFDRMLIAQAQAEGLTIVTADRYFTNYTVHLLEAGIDT